MENSSRIVRINEQPVHPRNSFIPANRRRYGPGNRFQNRHSSQSHNGFPSNRPPPANSYRKEDDSDKDRKEQEDEKKINAHVNTDHGEARTGSDAADGEIPNEEVKIHSEEPVQTAEKPKVNLVNKFRVEGISYAAMIKGAAKSPPLRVSSNKEDQFPSLSTTFQSNGVKHDPASLSPPKLQPPVAKSVSSSADALKKPTSGNSDENASDMTSQMAVPQEETIVEQKTIAAEQPEASPSRAASKDTGKDSDVVSGDTETVAADTESSSDQNAQTVPTDDSQKTIVVPDVIPTRRLAPPPSRPAWTGKLPASITAKPVSSSVVVPISQPQPQSTPSDTSSETFAQICPPESAMQSDLHQNVSQTVPSTEDVITEKKSSTPSPESLSNSEHISKPKMNGYSYNAAYRPQQGEGPRGTNRAFYGNEYDFGGSAGAADRRDYWTYGAEHSHVSQGNSYRRRGQFVDSSSALLGMEHQLPNHPPNVAQYYQPVTEICTRNGPLLVNTLVCPVYEGDSGQRLRSPATPLAGAALYVIKSFYFPTQLTGVVLGKNGTAIREAQQQFSCQIWIDEADEPRWPGQSLLHFYGFGQCVDGAVEKIRLRLEKCGGEMQAIAGVQSVDFLRPYIPRLELALGVTLHVFVAHVEKNGVVFLQMPGNPSFLRLLDLEKRLTAHCSDQTLAPCIDPRSSPLLPGCLVAAPTYGLVSEAISASPSELISGADSCDNSSSVRWLRSVVIAPANAEGRLSLRSLDHGFTFTTNCNNVKVLPMQFCGTPCQAIECRVVHGKYYEDRAIAEQVSRSVSNNVLRQWVKVRQVSTIMDFDLLLGMQSEGTEVAVPVVEMWIAR
ncbi:uncharacterized protein LOC129581619 [Paramacrobiotus metropolitanus]|uniref:uncharacterized protein LOC129581619 n=1 Tax=Paramacrobiotus metropolitanus TaxID=2943436 RepID=UPI002445B32A|nr:uncharacterized protein LOC129581619 [Paramacrobiotus metropolitanus]